MYYCFRLLYGGWHSLISSHQQFVWQNFVEDYSPTDSRHTYYPTVIVNNRLYELKITDLPALPYFPVNSVYELAECQCGLRDATAYMMVLDVSALDSFQYLETVREQIAESRDISAVPFLVVGNKIDLFDSEDDECLVQRRAIMDRVKGLWGCGYAECSARYSSLVCQVFRQLIMSMNQDQTGANACPSLFHDTLGATKCSVLWDKTDNDSLETPFEKWLWGTSLPLSLSRCP